MASLQFFSGLILLFLGGEMIVRYVIALAYKVRLSPLFISMTLIGFTTSLPELITCVDAGLRGASGIVIGNIVGSNISNVLFIIGIGGVIAPLSYPYVQSLKREGSMLLLSVVVTFGFILYGEVSRTQGLILLLLLIGYTLLSIRQERARVQNEENVKPVNRSKAALIALSVIGVGITLIGADLLISGAVDIARWIGVSETIIGLSLVALGTSLPELATTLTAIRRGQGAIALGNILGSNIYNIFGIMGVTAIIVPFQIPVDFDFFSLWVMTGATFCLLFFTYTHRRISSLEGLLLLSGYGVYLAILF